MIQVPRTQRVGTASWFDEWWEPHKLQILPFPGGLEQEMKDMLSIDKKQLWWLSPILLKKSSCQSQMSCEGLI